MNNKLLPTVTFLMLLISFSACRKKNQSPNFKSHFALSVGNTWTYDESYYYPDSASAPNSVLQVKIEIIKDTLIENNQLAYVIKQTYNGNSSSYQYLWYQVDNELRERYYNSAIYSVKYRTDMERGSEWVMTPNVTTQEFNSRKVIEQYSKFPVLTGYAAAFKVQNGNPNLNAPDQYGELAEEVFAPGIGVIESDYRINYYGPSRQHRILTDYYID